MKPIANACLLLCLFVGTLNASDDRLNVLFIVSEDNGPESDATGPRSKPRTLTSWPEVPSSETPTLPKRGVPVSGRVPDRALSPPERTDRAGDLEVCHVLREDPERREDLGQGRLPHGEYRKIAASTRRRLSL